MAYKSEKRDEPFLKVPAFDIASAIVNGNTEPSLQDHPGRGVLPYTVNGPSFHDTYNQSQEVNRATVIDVYPGWCERLKEIIELEYTIASHYIWVIESVPYATASPVFRALFSTFAANLLASNTALDLTLSGLYSHARPLLRQTYEGLMIAKLCSVDPNCDIYDKWLDGKYIRFTPEILDRIQHPSSGEFKTMWNTLSSFTHASSFSGQPDLASEPVIQQALLNFVLLHMLLEANYHLLCGHVISPSMRYYQKAWTPSTELKKHREKLKTQFAAGKRAALSKQAKIFVRDFRTTWRLAS